MNQLAIIWHDLAFEHDAQSRTIRPARGVAEPLGQLHRAGFELVVGSCGSTVGPAADTGEHGAGIDALHAAQRALRLDIVASGGLLHAALFSPLPGSAAVREVLASVVARRRSSNPPVLLTGLESVASSAPADIARVLLITTAPGAQSGHYESLAAAVAHLHAGAAPR